MSFGELLRRVQRRVGGCLEARRADTVQGESAPAEATALWRATRSSDPDAQADLAATLLLEATAGDPRFLDAAISVLAGAVAGQDADHPRRLANVSTLAAAYQVRFERMGVSADLDRALQLGEQAVDGTPADHPDRADILSNLSATYLRRFERGGRRVIADIHRAIELGAQAVAVAPADGPHCGGYLTNLCGAYLGRFKCTGLFADLNQAIELGEQALAIMPTDDPHRAGALSNLGMAYLRRFEHTGVTTDLDQALELGEQALATTPTDDPHRAGALSDLGMAYLRRFEHTGVFADLDQALELGEQALAIMPTDDPDRAANLFRLGAAYFRGFEHTGVSADLDRAIELLGQAVAASPANTANRATCLSGLCGAYLRRFEHTGVFADLDQALELGERALATTPTDHPDRARTLSNLGVAYHWRSERAGVLRDLDRAIELLGQAVDATPTDHPGRAAYLSNLGMAYRSRHVLAGIPADLDRAIEVGGQAVDATPANHPDRAAYLSNLGMAYRSRYRLTRVLADLDQAIELGGQAVDATPADHPSQSEHLANLGIAYLWRFELAGRGIEREKLRALAQRVGAARAASPADRARAARVVGVLAHASGAHATAVELLDAAVAMMPLVAPRESAWADQEHRLGEHTGLVGDVVAAHCAIGDPAGAVEAAELGRGVLLAAQLDSRTDLSDLDQSQPELATRFRRVRDRLNTPSTSGDGPAVGTDRPMTEDRRRLWAEHDELLTQIRRCPGFAQFMLPPRLAELRSAGAGGAVVLVNVGSYRSDAVIITSSTDPVAVPLPGLALNDAQSHAQALLEAIQDGTRLAGTLRRQRVLPDVLGWLWDAVVEPILDTLTPAAGNSGPPPRVWWLPTGLLGLFPLHAAGHPGQPGALDRVVSSYTPTLRALAHTRARSPAAVRRQLTVALAHTPGLPDLPGTAAEAAALHANHPGIPPLIDQDATTDHVLPALPQATWAHFACHATADPTAPSRSGLRLHDGTLPLPNISRLQLTHAELAYLSACSTAHGGTRLADESLHLASAFQLAGFRHVVASLWPLNDHIAATAAAAFYRHLPPGPAADHAANALRHVTRELRAEQPDRPDLWAALIHSGP